MKFVKAVHAYVTLEEFSLWSLMPGDYAVEYFPDTWIYPTLPESRLFAFDDLQAAIVNRGIVIPGKLPYQNVMLWYCLVADPVRRPILKTLPEWSIRRYWMLINNGLKDYKVLKSLFPWIYHYKYDVKAVLGTAIKLVQPVHEEDMEKYKNIDYSFLDK